MLGRKFLLREVRHWNTEVVDASSLQLLQSQVGWGSKQHGLVEDVSAHGRGWNELSFKVTSSPSCSVIL